MSVRPDLYGTQSWRGGAILSPMGALVPNRGGRRRPGPKRRSDLPSGRDEVRRAVLDAAAADFAERGVAQVSLRDVSRRARVNVGLISRYVGNRDDLIRAVFEDLTSDLVAEIESNPLEPRGFDKDSTMGRWVKVLTYLVIVDPAVASEVGSAPIHRLTDAVSEAYGLDQRAASLRVAQVLGSAIGWRLFEPYLVDAAGLSDVPLDELREELTRTHRRIGATPLPSPPDPPTVARRGSPPPAEERRPLPKIR